MAISESVFNLEDLDGNNGFRVDGVWVSGRSGTSVSTAGDVNGDGIDDFIIGESGGRPGNLTQAGAAHVVFGDATGLPAEFKLADLDGANGFSLNGQNPFDNLGSAVSGAGDLNGDGIDDVIVGAPNATTNFEASGAGYVVFGSSSGFDAGIDLSSLDGSNGFKLEGGAAEDGLGSSVSGAGDINGDGLADLIIGAPMADTNPEDAGKSYVVFGSAAGFAATVDLNNLDGVDGFRIDGESEDDESGKSVSGAGDVNGDGIDDLIVGAPIAELGLPRAGISYIIYGKTSGFDPAVVLDSIDGSNGFRLGGAKPGETSGESVSAAGDVNGDGVGDLIIGASYNSNNGGLAGAAYIVFGKDGGFSVDFDLATLDGSNGFRLDGDQGDRAGISVSGAGDFNNDGFDDLLVGGRGYDADDINTGAGYLIFGKAGAYAAAANLNELDGTVGIRFNGVNSIDLAGNAVSGAGDVNNDGFDDLIVAADVADNGGSGTGSSYVIFGSATVINSLPIGSVLIEGNAIEGETLTASEDLVDANGKGTVAYQWSVDGIPVEGATDSDFLLTGDHIGTAITVAASYTDGAGNQESVSSAPTIRVAFADGVRFVADLDGSSGLRLDGDSVNDRAATAVSAAGDFNGDGIDDLLVGAYLDASAGGNAGTSYVVLGKDGGFDPILTLNDLDGADGFKLTGADFGDYAGWSVSHAGDVNADGFDDVIIGAINADPDGLKAGAGYVVFGAADGLAESTNLGNLDGSNGFRLDGVALDDLAGTDVSSAGDINGDGYDDLLVSARQADSNGTNSGSSYVVFGKAAGFTPVIELGDLDGSNGFRLDGGKASDNSGASVSGAGDINNDGFDDLMVGASGADNSGSSSGSIYLVYGKAGAFDPTQNLAELDGADGFRLDGEAAVSYAGFSVSDAGDINGDGIDDLIVGVWGNDYNGSNSGSSYVLFGSETVFPAALNLAEIDGSNGFRLDGVSPGDNSGLAVSGAGDVNGDGFDDVVVGSLLASANGEFSGAAYVVYGKDSGFDAAIDLGLLDGSDGFRVDGEAADDQLGSSVGGIGDINYDGYDDVLVGAPQADFNGLSSGSGYVVFGQGMNGILLEGGVEGDILGGTRGEDTLVGGGGRDRLLVSHGSDTLDGGDDIDHAVFAGSIMDFTALNSGGELSVYGPFQKDALVGVERLQFDDLSLAFDLDGNAGDIAKLLGVMLGKDAWYSRELIGVGLDIVDAIDIDYAELFDVAFSVIIGPNPTDEQVMSLIYTNLIGEAPTQGIVDALVADLLTSGAFTQGSLGALAADTDFNAANIDLIGLTMNGLEYLPGA